MNLFRMGLAYIQARRAMAIRSRRKLEERQLRLLRRHFRFVLEHSPFYRRRFREAMKGWESPELTWERLGTLPLMDKETMMSHFDELNTAGIRKEEAFRVAWRAEETRDFTPQIGGVTVGLSSGTTHNRGLFLVSKEERERWAGNVLAKLLPRGVTGRESVAFFLRANSNLYTTVSQRWLTFAYYDLMEDLSAHVERLNRQKPTILVAPPAVLTFLSEEKERGRLDIAPVKVISVADVLDDRDRQKIEGQFGKPVHQIYQCTEGFLAATCSHGTLHLNEDIVHIEREWIDRESGRFVPIVTDFCRKTQPIIRYRLNDILVLADKPCPCGSAMTAIERVEGRCDDMFYLKDEGSGRYRPVFPDFIRRAMWQAGDEIRHYQVVQEGPDRIAVAFEERRGTDRKRLEEAIRSSFAQLFRRLGVEEAAIRFAPYRHPPADRKLRRVKRDWSP